MSRPKLLIVEDDEGLCSQYRWSFPGYEILMAQARLSALALVKRENPAVAIMDLGLPPEADGVSEGFATLTEVLRIAPQTKVIIVTGNGERCNALRAIALGAYDFCEKPIEIEVLRTIIERGLKLHRLEAENRRLAAFPPRSPIERIVTADAGMLKVCRDIEKIAMTNVPVLLLGESGTGKEALAKAVHDLGTRAKQAFVAINCGAIPENLLESELFGHERGAFTGAVKQTIGRIEQAHKGTLFLDEIGDLPHPLQVKLLRFLQDQIVERIGGRQKIQVDVRIVSATNVDLDERISQGMFRGDLLYRMNAFTLRVPPLRERGSDVILLANTFLTRFNLEFGRGIRGFTASAIVAMNTHDWCGNVRELENRLKRAVVMSERRLIDAADLELAPAVPDAPDLDLRSARLRAERAVIQEALARSNQTLAVAARLLGISRPTLYGLMETHGLATGAVKPGDDAAGDGPTKAAETTMQND